MGDVTKIVPNKGQIERFEPDRYRLRDAALDYSIKHAKRIKDWPTLEDAVRAKIAEQHLFVAWWKANVRGDGNPHGLTSRDHGRLPMREAERLTQMPNQRVSDLSKALAAEDKYALRLLGVEYQTAYLNGKEVRGTQGTGENEWFTPIEYIDKARAVLGDIDLDPATHSQAQAIIKANRFYTKKDNGLQNEWRGHVWLNPPYAQPLIAQFVAKMVAEYIAERVTAGIMLTHNYTDTSWFHEAASCAHAICFTRGRIKFYDPGGKIAAPTQGQAFFYFGEDVKGFAKNFDDVGFVTRII